MRKTRVLYESKLPAQASKKRHSEALAQPVSAPNQVRPALHSATQRLVTPDVIEALQHSHGNQFVQRLIGTTRQSERAVLLHQGQVTDARTQRTVQRLKELEWKGSKREEVDKDAPATQVDISTLNVEKLSYYQAVYNYQQQDSMAYPNVVFEAGDIEAIQKALSLKEQSGSTIYCPEKGVKLIGNDQEVDFGDVTTCMTVTCIFSDGSKAVAHEGMELKTDQGLVGSLKPLIQGKTVTRVMAIGAGEWWGFNSKEKKLKSAMEGAQHNISGTPSDLEAFKEYLQQELGGSVEFKDHDQGAIHISKTGEYNKK